MFEERALSTCRRTVPFWLRNVDDTFTTVRHDEIDASHHNPDGRNTDIQFTRDEVRKRKFHKRRKLCCTTGLDGYHLSGFFCDFQEAFETEKKPRDFFGVVLVTLIFTMQVLLQDYWFQVDEHVSFLDYSIHKLALAILRFWTRATAEEEGLLIAHHSFVLSGHHQTQQVTYGLKAPWTKILI